MAVPVFIAFTGSTGFACDFLPYQRSASFYRTLAAARPEDWTNNAALTSKADDTQRYVEVAASSRASWLPSSNNDNVEALACFLMRPGTYTSPTLALSGAVEARVDTSAGTISLYVSNVFYGSQALPASVWTNSSTFVDCWVRLHQNLSNSGKYVCCKVWSTTEAEPASWLPLWADVGGWSISSSDPPGIGSTYVAALSACSWFSYGVSSPAPTPRRASDAAYFDKWLAAAHAAGSASPRVMTADIYVPGLNGVTPQQAVLRVATQGYDGGTAWPMGNQPYLDAMLSYPTLERALPDAIFGRQRISAGALQLSNPLNAAGVGLRDDWLRMKMQRGTVVLRYGSPAWPWYDLQTMFTGEVVDVSDEPGTITVTLRDGMSRYDRKVTRTLIASGPNAGKPKPISLGAPFNVTPVVLDATALTYYVGASTGASDAVNSVTAVRDRGVALTDLTIGTVISYDTATNTLKFLAAHGRSVGSAIKFNNGTLPSPLSTGVTYFVKTVPASDTMTLAATPGGSTITLSGTPASWTIAAAFPSSDLLRTTATHTLAAGDGVLLSSTIPGGLAASTLYYVLSSGLTSTDMKVSTSAGGSAVNITASDTLTVTTVNFTNGSQDYLGFGSNHSWAANQALALDGAMPSPISSPALVYRHSTFNFSNAVIVCATSGGSAIDLTNGTTGGTVSSAQGGGTITKAVMSTAVAPAWALDAATGTLTLAANPAGQITCDLQGQKFAGSYAATAGHAVRALIGQGDPLVSTAVGSGSVLAAAVGLWLPDDANLADLLDELALSCASVWGVNRIGTLVATAAIKGFNIANSTGTITDADLLPSVQRWALERKLLPCAWINATSALVARNYTRQQPSDLSPLTSEVSLANRAAYGAEGTVVQATLSSNPTGPGDDGSTGERRSLPRFDTLLTDAYQPALVYDNAAVTPYMQTAIIRVGVRWGALDAIRVGRIATVKSARLGWDAGVAVLVLGITEDVARGALVVRFLAPITGYYPTVS